MSDYEWVDRLRQRGRTVTDARPGCPPPVTRFVAPQPSRVRRWLTAARLWRERFLDWLCGDDRRTAHYRAAFDASGRVIGVVDSEGQ